MKNFKVKRKIVSIFSIVILIGAFLAPVFAGFLSIFSTKNHNIQEVDTANAIDYLEYTNNLVDEMKTAITTDFSEKYSYKDEFPVFAEHQTSSKLCWAYSASKVAETTLMLGIGEYYNFSEVATAYFAYLNGLNETIDSFGSFTKFDNTIKQSGIVHESDFSNDNIVKVNETNASKFNHVKDFADKSLPQKLIPIYLSNNNKFKESNNQENIIKYYLKNYGGLNIALPSGSMFRYDEFTGRWVFDTTTSQNEGKPINENHAVCLIGWNDSGFVGLNSWGVDDSESYEEVVIPYSIMNKYYNDEIKFQGSVNHDWLCGYNYVEDSSVVISSSSAQKFSSTILNNVQNDLKNVFYLTEEIELVYKISNVDNFDTVYVEISKGGQDVTSKFNISYDDTDKEITINWVPTDANFSPSTTFYGGGTYLIRIFEDVNLMTVKSFSIFTGSEISYVKLENNISMDDTVYYSMMNNFATSDNTETYYINYAGSYQLDMYLTDLGELKQMTGEPSADNLVRIVEFAVYDESNSKFVSETNNGYLAFQGNNSSTQNCYSFILRNLTQNFVGKLIRFKVNIFSPYAPTKCIQQFYFNFFVSGVDDATASANAYQVSYVLNGGKNSINNVDIYPQYTKDQMTSVKLASPERVGYTFDGWYLDSAFATELQDSLLCGDIAGNIVLYAKWIYSDTSYYTSNLTIANVYNYDKSEKDLTGLDFSTGANLTYGESIKLKALFNLTDDLINETFTFKYYYYVNGALIDEVALIQSSDMGRVQESYSIYFGGLNDEILSYPNFEAGSYVVEVVSVAVIRHKFSITESLSYNVLVNPKEVNVIYDSNASIFTYDAQEHLPKASFAGYYVEDASDFVEVKFNGEAKTNFGEYSYKILDITNANYKINESEKNKDYWLYINKKQLVLNWTNSSAFYNGRAQYPVCEIEGIIEGDVVSVSLDSMGYVNAGTYTFEVQGTSNVNYDVPTSQKVTFVIKPAPITVKFNDVEERAQSAIAYRTQITFKVEGNLYDSKDSLNIEGYSLGLTKMDAGEYEINGSYDNSNYDVHFIPGIYLLTGYYYVYYTMPDGEIVSELVNYGETPKGVEHLIKISKLKKIQYSTELIETGDDIYVIVTVKDYTWYVVIGAFIVGFVFVYWFITRKIRRNKVR